MSKTKQKSIDELLKEALVPKDEQPYQVPENWTYFYFTSILDIQGGTQPPKSQFINEPKEGYIRLVQIRDFASDDYLTYIPYTNKLRLIEEEDILIARYGASVGRILTGLSGAYNVALAKVVYPKEHIYRKYLYWLLQTEHFQGPLKMISRSAQAGFNKNDLSNIKLPLPPYNEQKRIAEKIERLFAKIDEAKRLIEEVKESVELRRAAILDRAFRGELGTNDPNEKGMLEESNVITKRDIVPENEQLYEVPKNWIWVKAGNVTEVVGGGTPKTTVREYYENGNVPWITPADLSDFEGIYISRGQRNITSEGLRNSSAKLLPAKTVLLSSRAPIGYVAIAANLLSTNQGFKSFIPSDVIDSEYLYWYLKKSKKYLEGMGSGSTFKEISASKCKEIKIPLPPINEQKRISKRVGMLLNNLDREKEMVLEVEEKLDLLKQSILSKAFRGELGTNDPNDEHAIELLKEVLKSK
ncbi:restriction endonuclease subunit S [Anoxybacillus sp. FSL W8-0104]|uniref:Type I restriction-modification system specificity subunit S n=1 Tax=Anoxybacillus flavithermus TaxID=33934 RepID=A0A178T5J2_9BACL|nr:restriction endonuclease subunit S [Anoxybacillus flavithermus]OAO76242.1 Type I restriction-modification system specificity subunit S [Anoxybacillus flavithermus]